MGKFLVVSAALFLGACGPVSNGVFSDNDCIGTGIMKKSGAAFCLLADGNLLVHYAEEGVVRREPATGYYYTYEDYYDVQAPTGAVEAPAPLDGVK